LTLERRGRGHTGAAGAVVGRAESAQDNALVAGSTAPQHPATMTRSTPLDDGTGFVTPRRRRRAPAHEAPTRRRLPYGHDTARQKHANEMACPAHDHRCCHVAGNQVREFRVAAYRRVGIAALVVVVVT